MPTLLLGEALVDLVCEHPGRPAEAGFDPSALRRAVPEGVEVAARATECWGAV